jgi:hypothetical protein
VTRRTRRARHGRDRSWLGDLFASLIDALAGLIR